MFIMGIVLDYSNVWPDAKCKMNPGERNYNVCFFMFSLMMFRLHCSHADPVQVRLILWNY